MTTNPAQFLRERGIHATAQRLAVLRVVTAHPHVSADSVAVAAAADIGTISRQAVYDTLGLLSDRGIIRRIQPVGSPARYEDRIDDNHHHVVCRLCGRMADVNCAVGYAPCLTAENDSGYEIDEAEVVYWGRCPQCRSDSDVTSNSEVSISRGHDLANAATEDLLPTHQRTTTP